MLRYAAIIGFFVALPAHGAHKMVTHTCTAQTQWRFDGGGGTPAYQQYRFTFENTVGSLEKIEVDGLACSYHSNIQVNASALNFECSSVDTIIDHHVIRTISVTNVVQINRNSGEFDITRRYRGQSHLDTRIFGVCNTGSLGS
jgi:hypothetical protein